MKDLHKLRCVVGIVAIVVGGLVAGGLVPWDHVVVGLGMVVLGAALLTP